jgi:hypothetical protein
VSRSNLRSTPLGLAVQRHGDELRLVTAPEVTASVERHLNVERPLALSKAALEVPIPPAAPAVTLFRESLLLPRGVCPTSLLIGTSWLP